MSSVSKFPTYKVGYTSGVYDMFHIGHLNLIKQSKMRCENLIVSVTTDDLCRKVKNKNPIICFENRLEIVSSIKYVDHAIPQDTMDKFGAWEKLKFNVIFVGDDWKGHPRWIELEEKFKTVHVDVVYLPYTKDISSTFLRKEYCL